MTEFRVWRSIVDWVEDSDGIVIAACPPGSSVYDYKKFCLIDPVSGKRDEPDILFLLDGFLYIIECKPNKSSIFAKGLKASSDESDIDKLRRIRCIFESGYYTQQLRENYGVNISDFPVRIGIGYADTKNKSILPIKDVIQFIVKKNMSIKIVG